MPQSDFWMDAEGLHRAGRTMSTRAPGGETAAKGLKEGLDGASGTIGHHVVKSALSTFVTNDILDHANKLPLEVEQGGINVSNVAGATSHADNETSHALKSHVETNTALGQRINPTRGQ